MNTSRAKLVERDGYAPSPPHCKCGVLLLSLRPQSGHDGGTRTREPQLCRLVPWLLGHVVIEKETAAQVTRRRKTSPTSVLNDRGLNLVEPAGFAPAPCVLKVRCATVKHHSSKNGARAGNRTQDCGLADRHVALTLQAQLKLAPAGLGPPAGFT